MSDKVYASLGQRTWPLPVGPFLYFPGAEDPWGREPWRTDATAHVVEMVADVAPGWDSSYPEEFTLYDGDLYFNAVDDLVGRELWRIRLAPEAPRRSSGRRVPGPP